MRYWWLTGDVIRSMLSDRRTRITDMFALRKLLLGNYMGEMEANKKGRRGRKKEAATGAGTRAPAVRMNVSPGPSTTDSSFELVDEFERLYQV